MKTKATVMLFVVALFVGGGNLYAASGDLVVNGNLTVSTLTVTGSMTAPNVMTKYYQSPERTITSGQLFSLPHGMGTTPLFVSVWLKCYTADCGYAVGDLVIVNPSVQEIASNRGVSLVADASNLSVKYGSNSVVFSVLNKSTGGYCNLTNGNWKAIFRAMAM